MEIEPIEDENSDFTLVRLRRPITEKLKHYPYCNKHGAMNKVSLFEGGGYWRCLQGLRIVGCN